AQPGERRTGMVGFADRYATRRDDRIGARSGVPNGRLQRIRTIRNHAEIDRLDAEPLEQGTQRISVAVINPPRLRRISYRQELIAGGKERHADTPSRKDPVETEGGGQTDVGRAETPSRQQGEAARDEILAGDSPVLASPLARR